MEVRVKEGERGFIYGELRTEGKTFNLKPIECIDEVDEKGKPVILSPESQFSNKWMEKTKKPGRPKTTKDIE